MLNLVKRSKIVLVILALECLFTPLVKSEEKSAGDIVIIGNTSDKQSEIKDYWTGYGKKRTVSNPQPDEDIARYCRAEQRNPYSAYAKYSECVKTESKAKDLLLSTKIKNETRATDRTSCYYQSTGYNSSAPTSWSYRYICIKTAVERQKRNQQDME
jgi:hypothetical protein